MTIAAAGHEQVMFTSEFNVACCGFGGVPGMPAFDAVNEVQHMFLDDPRLPGETGGQANERGAVGVVGVGQHQDTAGISYEFRGFGKGERVFGDVTPDQVFIEGLLPVRDNASGYQVVGDVGSAEGTVNDRAQIAVAPTFASALSKYASNRSLKAA